jgi:thymidylate kinase
MSLLAEVLWPSDLGQESRDPFGKKFWILTMAAWYSAMHHNRLSALLNKGDSLIIDSWYYRLIVKMAIAGLDPKWMNELFKDILVPSIVILLDIEPDLAWRRTEASQKNFKLFETGSWHIEEEDDFSRYCKWQGQVRSELLKMAKEQDWYIIEQSEGQTADSVARIIANHIRERAKSNLDSP